MHTCQLVYTIPWVGLPYPYNCKTIMAEPSYSDHPLKVGLEEKLTVLGPPELK